MLRILIFNLLVGLYPAHLSMTSIEHVAGTDSLKVLLKMDYGLFLRDYQTIDDDKDLGLLGSYNPFPDDLVNNYISSKVFIYINNKLLTGKLLMMDLSGSEIEFDFLYRSVRNPRTITVRNTILTTLHSDQVNLTIIKIKNLETGIRLTPDHNEESFRLN